MRQASGIDHVGVTSSDLERSLAFYCDLLGMIVIDQGVEESTEIATLLGIDGVSFEFADLDSGDGRVFELLRYRRPEGTPRPVAQPFDPGTPHLAIRVADLDAVAARLAEAGVTDDLTRPAGDRRARNAVGRRALPAHARPRRGDRRAGRAF